MPKSQRTEMILQEVRKDIEQFMSEEDTITSSIEYEDKVIEICRSLRGSFKEARSVQVH